MICSLYLDVGTFSGGHYPSTIPVGQAAFACWLLFISRTDALLPHEVGEDGYGDILPSPRVPMGWFRGRTLSFWSHLPVSSPIANSSSAIGRRSLQTKGGSDCHPASTQMRGGQATTHLSNSYRTAPRLGLNWNMSLPRRHRRWPKGMNVSELNRPGGYARRQAQLLSQTEATFQEVFSCRQIQLRPSILLPWCVNAAMPLCYISRVVGYFHLTGGGHPLSVRTVPYRAWARALLAHQLQVPPRALTPPSGSSPPLVSSIPDIPLSGTPLVGHPSPFLSTTSSQEKWDHSHQWFTWPPSS